MNTTVQLNIPLTTNQLAALIRQQLPKEERLRLATMLQVDEELEPTNEEILANFRRDYAALTQGTLKTRPIQALLDEL